MAHRAETQDGAASHSAEADMRYLKKVSTLTFAEARVCVLDRVRSLPPHAQRRQVELVAANGRVLAEEVRADRDYPALSRSVRDGFAVRAVDLPGELAVIGEVRAGEKFAGEVGRSQAVEIMTGAPVRVAPTRW